LLLFWGNERDRKMADIKDCIGKNIKISRNSITIKSDEGKTCGVVRNIISLYDLQPNKQMDYYRKLREIGLHGKISIKQLVYMEHNMKKLLPSLSEKLQMK